MVGDISSPPPGAEVVTTSSARLWMGEDGILRIYCLPGSVHTIKEARENVSSFRHRLVKKVPCLIDLRPIGSITREAREFFRGPENDGITAAALLIGSPLSAAIGNFFTGLSKMRVEHRLFTSEAEAIAWLKQHRAIELKRDSIGSR